MIKGVGVDIVNIKRMEHWLDVEGMVERFFYPEEIKAVKERGTSAVVSLAARFAAKEAFGKALGTGLRGIKLADIEVRNNSSGRPDIVLHGTALKVFMDGGGGSLHLSLTHEKEMAAAVVIIEEVQNGK